MPAGWVNAASGWTVGNAGILRTAEGLSLINFPNGRAGYRNAQVDDYRGRSRRAFLWRPPVQLTVQARFAPGEAGLQGTAGFGFWNDPFLMSGLRTPTLPRAVWFFFASPPTDLPLAAGVPGWGWKAAVIDALHPGLLRLLPWAPLAPLLLRSARLQQRLWPHAQRALHVAEAPAPGPMTAWHTYQIDWGVDTVRFTVDGLPVLDGAPAPRGPLGFVMWIDNQWLVARPTGRLRFGALRLAARQQMEIDALSLIQG